VIDPQRFAKACRAAEIHGVVGVPDSLLKSASQALELEYGTKHRILANEGSAIAFAIGSYAATGRMSLVYLQNSGLGNAVNPLASLAHNSVFGCPMVLLIGWRGETQRKGEQTVDEPQHQFQGKISVALIELLGLAYQIIDAETEVSEVLPTMVKRAASSRTPVVLLVRKGSFEESSGIDSVGSRLLSREDSIGAVLGALPFDVPVVAATGMIGREVLDYRIARGETGLRDLLVVGGMGHASTIASAIAAEGSTKVVCLDGDGGVLMHMGALPHVASESRIVHVVLNNGAHDSVGGQKTIVDGRNFEEIARGSGYGSYANCISGEQIENEVGKALASRRSAFIEIQCSPGHRSNLMRPELPPQQSFREFAGFLQNSADAEGSRFA
jgi:phosphonopyruvate decarboxylase